MTADTSNPSLFRHTGPRAPLAARMRPGSLQEFSGQEELLAPGRPLRRGIESDSVGSIVLWGPPGTGKTTLARLIASHSRMAFEPFSAVSEGVPRLREIASLARERRDSGGGGTLLFIDEIHRLNKAQQDTLLPYVEEGLLTLVGATTEAPSMEINSALLSRLRVFTLSPLSPQHLVGVMQRALHDEERGLGRSALSVSDEVLDLIAGFADGDARRALTILEAAANLAGDRGVVTDALVRDALATRIAVHDKSGESHFNMLSAYHKSLRGSDPQGALYWMARLLNVGEDPLVIFRRAIAMAAEDVGLADPEALRLAVAAREAFHILGAPEGYLPLSELTIYLATAPKSNSSYTALNAALARARETAGEPVPLHIRNAPTALHAELGYHQGYRYAHDYPGGYAPQEYLPNALRGETFYSPGAFGFEKEIARRLEYWLRLRSRGETPPDTE